MTDAPGCSRFDRGSAWQNTRRLLTGAMAPRPERAGLRSGAFGHRGTPVPGAGAHRGPGVRGAPRRCAALVPSRLRHRAALALRAAPERRASFDPGGPCTTDGPAPGAYPELEALIPTTYEERAERLDSGRNCTRQPRVARAAGIDEVRFAGGTWDLGGYRAAALAVFSARADRGGDCRLLRRERGGRQPDRDRRPVRTDDRGPTRPSPRHDNRRTDPDGRGLAGRRPGM